MWTKEVVLLRRIVSYYDGDIGVFKQRLRSEGVNDLHLEPIQEFLEKFGFKEEEIQPLYDVPILLYYTHFENHDADRLLFVSHFTSKLN